jgi:formylglycine-generating enzyme required for sulfatase activity
MGRARRLSRFLSVVLAVAILLAATHATAQQEPARIALLIGNKDYSKKVGPLTNPHNDVEIVGAALKSIGFEILQPVKDARRAATLSAVRQFAARLRAAGPGAMGFVYYSGHGAAETDTNTNYLIPIDAPEPGSVTFWDEALKLDDILKLLSTAREAAKFVVFDACRNELAATDKNTSKGFVSVAEQAGMFIAYATAAGRTASDSGSSSGPYANALAREVVKRGVHHLDLFQNIKEAVSASTGGVQQPWESNGLARRVYLAGRADDKPAAPPASAAQPSTSSAAARDWQDVKDINSIAVLERYIQRHKVEPVYAALAQDRIEGLKRQQQAEAARQADAAKQAEGAKKKAEDDARARGEIEARAKADAERQRVALLQQEEARKATEAAAMPTASLCARIDERSCKAIADCAWIVPTKIDASTGKADNPYCRKVAGVAKKLADAARQADATKQADTASALQRGRVFRDCPECPEMVVIPTGEFTMGSPASEEYRGAHEGPQRKVTIRQAFAAGKVEVTFAEWDACVAASGCKHKPDDQRWGRGKRPVINVSWDDITKEYLPWLSRKAGKTYRLLTESEWEYAARAGTTTRYAFGDQITKQQAQFSEGSLGSAGKTAEVGSFQPNRFGLFDMHGNVWEWVEDCYTDNDSSAPTDGRAVADAPSCLRVLRGGSWFNGPRILRSAYRFGNLPGDRGSDFGFRVARTLSPP